MQLFEDASARVVGMKRIVIYTVEQLRHVILHCVRVFGMPQMKLVTDARAEAVMIQRGAVLHELPRALRVLEPLEQHLDDLLRGENLLSSGPLVHPPSFAASVRNEFH